MINIRLAVHPLIQSRTVVPSYGGFNRGVETPVVALCHVRDATVGLRGGDGVSVTLTNYTSSVVLDQTAVNMATKFFETLDVRTPFLIVFSDEPLSDVMERPEFVGSPASYILNSSAFKSDLEEVSRTDVDALQLGIPVRIYAVANSHKYLEALVSVSTGRAKYSM